MVPRNSHRISPLDDRFSALSLVVATVVTCLVIGACRLLAKVLSLDSIELDGIVCMAVIYWILSVVGYFTSSTRRERQQRRSGERSAYRMSRVARRMAKAESGLQGSLP